MIEVLVILQARMSSSRLPGKVLKLLQGKPMLEHQLLRISRMKTPHHLVVATSDAVEDNEINSLCNELNISCYRGALDDVLGRYYHAATDNNKHGNIKHIVRLTGDCPLIESDVIDNVITHYMNQQVDYCSNCCPPTFPDGLDVEVLSLNALKTAYKKAEKASEREHVTPFIRNNPKQFSQTNYANEEDLSHFRWTVDEAVDFELVSKIYQALYPNKPAFNLADILALIVKKPELAMLNNKIARNEGLIKSEREDQKFIKTGLT